MRNKMKPVSTSTGSEEKKSGNVVKLTIPGMRHVTRPCLTPEEWLARRIEPADHLLGELFTTTARVLFSADTGLGKTMTGLAWAFAMGLGRNFLHWRAKRRARVLYIDGEMPREVIQERIALACRWFAVEASEAGRIKILSREDFEDMPPLDTQDGQQWLDEMINSIGHFDFIVFDNIMSLCSGIMKEEDSWQAMKPFVLSLTKRRMGQLWLHHTGHDKTRAYGTKTREWHMDTVMVAEEVHKDHISFNLKFNKARRRTPTNRDDYKETHIELVDGKWSGGQATVGLNPSETIALQALREEIAKDDHSEEAWRKRAYELGVSKSTGSRARQQAFHRARSSLMSSELVKFDGNEYSIVE